MKTLLLTGFVVALAALPARAQTVANGPYYAIPSWDQTLPAATRFIVLANFGSHAVLDRETGLVWERAPVQTSGWIAALFHCHRLSVGHRRGWRLPTIEELQSLTAENGTLPAGHPFQGIDNHIAYYWSSTRFVPTVDNAWTYNFGFGDSQTWHFDQHFPVWCVRGGANAGNLQ